MPDQVASTVMLSIDEYHELRRPACAVCAVTFDKEAAKGLGALEVRQRWPRFEGKCSGCGFYGIRYASREHYVAGDW